MKRRLLIGIIMSLISALLLSACGTSSKSTSSTEKENIVVGVRNDFNPYSYKGTDGKLTGYEIAVLKEINKKLPQYNFKYEELDFQNMLIGGKSGKIDVITSQFEKNPEREKQYLFSETPIDSYNTRIVVKKGRKDINNLEDLKNKKIFVWSGTNKYFLMNKYNQEHNNLFQLAVGSDDNATLISNIQNGKYDAFLQTDRQIALLNKQFGEKLQTVGPTIIPANAYIGFNKKKASLKNDFDKAIKELSEDGTLKKLSIKYLKADYTKPAKGIVSID